MATAGRAVFFSGLTVLLGLVGLILFEFPILRSVGIAGAIVVGLAVAAALTLLPAILGVLGPRLDALRVRRVNAAADADGPWARLARRVMRHPVAVFVPTLAFLLLLGMPFLHVRFNAPDASILPPEVPSRAAYAVLDAQFGAGRFAPLYLAIRTTGPATSAANVGALYDYSRRLAADRRSGAWMATSMSTRACPATSTSCCTAPRPVHPIDSWRRAWRPPRRAT